MDPRRRFFLRGSLQAAGQPPAPPRPPWALRPDAEFTARCTRCGDCARACPHGLLVAGDGGFPEIRFDQHGCDFCGACAQACASGAIGRGGERATAFVARVQVASHCLAAQRVECRVCAEACDARALRFRPAAGGVWQLQVEREACTGCGDCVAPCPVAAITLAGSP